MSCNQIPKERLKYCPECYKNNVRTSRVERYQLEENSYLLFCTNKEDCFFTKEFEGIAVVNTADLITHGLPEQLQDHIDIYYEDINKIIRLCMYEHIRKKFIDPLKEKELDFKTMDYLINKMIAMHDEEGTAEPVRLSKCRRPFEVLQRKSEGLVSDLTVDYRERVKEAFYKIENYNFPEDFINLLISGKVPLFEVLESVEKKRRFQAELDEQVKASGIDLDGFNEFFS